MASRPARLPLSQKGEFRPATSQVDRSLLESATDSDLWKTVFSGEMLEADVLAVGKTR